MFCAVVARQGIIGGVVSVNAKTIVLAENVAFLLCLRLRAAVVSHGNGVTTERARMTAATGNVACRTTGFCAVLARLVTTGRALKVIVRMTARAGNVAFLLCLRLRAAVVSHGNGVTTERARTTAATGNVACRTTGLCAALARLVTTGHVLKGIAMMIVPAGNVATRPFWASHVAVARCRSGVTTGRARITAVTVCA